jgi:hypothetical protein
MLSYFVYAHLQLGGLEGKTLHKITTGKMCQIMLPAQSARLTSMIGSAELISPVQMSTKNPPCLWCRDYLH